jgi:hypothetical protein
MFSSLKEGVAELQNEGPLMTPAVFANSNAHGQIKEMEVKPKNSSILELVERSKFPDMTIFEINVAKPTVVNILDDETVHFLHQMITNKLNAIKPSNFDFNDNLVNTFNQLENSYTRKIIEIINQTIERLKYLFDELKTKLKSIKKGSTKPNLEDLQDDDGNSVIENIRDRYHFLQSFLKNGMFNYNFYSRSNPTKKMLKVYFSGDELTSVPQNWRIIAEELYEVPTTLPPGVKTFATIPEIIQQSRNVANNYIIGNSVDLLRYLSTTVTRNGVQRLAVTNEDIYEYLYKAGYRKVIMFNNSCATAINRENYEITDLRALRRIRREADTIREESSYQVEPTYELRQLERNEKINLIEDFLTNFKIDLLIQLREYGYSLSEANIFSGGSKTKSKTKSKSNRKSNRKSKRRSNKKSKRRNNRKTYKKRR